MTLTNALQTENRILENLTSLVYGDRSDFLTDRTAYFNM